MTTSYPKAGSIQVMAGNSPFDLQEHQTAAVKTLNEKVTETGSFAGLLVMPTGSGKTFTAAYWLLQNPISRKRKVLWIAHRHELLNQALRTFHQNACSSVVTGQRSIKYRIISGERNQHDRPVNIERDDDLLIVSKDSLRGRGLEYLINRWAKHQNELIFVIDEAHHATAKTYRSIIDNLRQHVSRFKILGLTATPIRTSEREQGLLKNVFPDDIVFKIDLKTLIARGILAEPTFREIQTRFAVGLEVSEADIKRIARFDLPEDMARRMAAQRERNHAIVSEYVRQSTENGGYGQTIVFALNIEHAITLDALFKERGVKSAFVVSSIRDSYTGANLSKEQNLRHIQDFRDGKLQVLVNVLILTEGIDLPQAQTVFLTRPTISEILMTQMIGRVLRGPAMGGTENAYVVSFIDDWQDKIHWASPEALLIRESVDIPDSRESRRSLIRLISIVKMQEFAIRLDRTIDTDTLEQLSAIDRVPIGVYSFTLQNEKQCVVLVYDHQKPVYDVLVRDLPQLFEEADLDDNLELDDTELERILEIINRRYLRDVDSRLVWRVEDIADMLRYFGEKGAEPPFLEFKDREKFNIATLAREIIVRDLGPRAESEYLMEAWNDEETFWRLYYGDNLSYFLYDVTLEKNKIIYPESFPTIDPPDISTDPSEDPPAVGNFLRDEVLARDGNRCLCCDESRRNHLQVDHVVPSADGGNNSFDNLQTLCRICNGLKTDTTIDFRRNHSPLTRPPTRFRVINLPPPEKANDHQAWKQYIRRRINFFFQCAAVRWISINSNNYCQISLHKGNQSGWLHKYLSTWEQETGLRSIRMVVDSRNQSSGRKLRTTSGQKKRLSDLPTGTGCRFNYKGRFFHGEISGGQLAISGKGRCSSFSKASRLITNTSRNGWKDWEIQLPNTTRWILADKWRKAK